MKYIPLSNHASTMRPGAIFSTADTIRTVIGIAPSGVNVAEMRKRIKVLDLLDDAKDGFIVVDADMHTMIKTAVEAYPFGIADKALLACCDAIFDAPDSQPNVVEMAANEDKAV